MKKSNNRYFRKTLSLAVCVAVIFSCLQMTAFAVTDMGSVVLIQNNSEAINIESDDTVVLYTNDVHCAIESYAFLAAYKAELISKGVKVLTVDAGDAIQGEVVGALTKGSAIIDIMNSVGYDYAVPGNHEYDYGMEVFLNLAENEASFEYISSNFCDLRNNEPVFKPYSIENVNGLDIAFVGITTPEAVTKSSPQYFKDENGNSIYGFPTYDMQDGVLAENIQESVDSAIENGADFVVAVGHLGIEGTSDGWKSTDVISDTAGIDVFLDAHSHEIIEGAAYKNENNEDVLLSSTGSKFNYIGQLVIDADGTAQTHLIAPDEIVVENLSADAKAAYEAVKEKTDDYNEEYAYLGDELGESEVKLVAYDENGGWLVRKSETNMGDFVADAYRTVTGADIAICNGGGVRAEIEEGTVIRKNLMDINPWSNEMCVIEVTGQQMIDILEHGVREYPEASGGFFQVSGISFEIDAWKDSPVITDQYGNFEAIDEAKERRVNNVKVAGEPIDLQEKYTLAGSKYVLTQGGDGLTMLDGARVVQDEGLPCDSEILIKYFTENLQGEITEEKYGNPSGDGRIIINEQEPDDIPDNEPDNESGTDDNTCQFCGGVHSNIYMGIFCLISSIIEFIFSLFR